MKKSNGSRQTSDIDGVRLPDLPKSWCWVTVNDIRSREENALAIGPFGSNLKVSHYVASGVPLVFVRNIRAFRFGQGSTNYISHQKAEELKAHEVIPGDILITKMGDPPGDSCLYPVGQPKAIITADCIKLRVEPDLGMPEFFELAIKSRPVQDQISVITKGVAQQKVSLGRFAQVRLPLAPLNEQRRIVAKIEELFSDLDVAVATLERVQAKLKRYRAAVLKSAVEGKLTEEWRRQHPNTEPATKLLDRILKERRRRWEEGQLAKFAAAKKDPPKNWQATYQEPAGPDTAALPELPEGWCWAATEQMTSPDRPILYGIIKPGPNTPGGVPYVRVMEMKNGTIDVDELKRCDPQRAKKFSRATLLGGDILISKDGTIGKVAMVPPELAGGSITQHLMRLSPTSHVNGRYIAKAIEAPVSQRWMKGETKGVALRGINVEDFRVMPIPLPPLDEQTQIDLQLAERLSQIVAAEIIAVHSLKRAALLRQTILKNAFEGKLVPQDPTDEPADKLLERIRAARNGSAVVKPQKGRRRHEEAAG